MKTRFLATTAAMVLTGWLLSSLFVPAMAQSTAAATAQTATGMPAVPVRPVEATSTLPALSTAAPLPALLPAYVRWQGSLAAFAKADKERMPGTDGVLFVGSSTIRLWENMAQDFRDVPVIINRGFGGSTLADCTVFVRELVTQYKPRQVLVYAGDNDLAQGQSPEQVLQSFVDFVRNVRADLPDTRITYISIKPSPLRKSLMPKAEKTNALIAQYAQTMPDIGYIDIYTPMLDATGNPKPEIFRSDRLHLNEAGYRLWQARIAEYLALHRTKP